MSEEFDPADYSFVVKRRGSPQKPWRWEIYCAGKSAPVERSPVFFESMAEAAKEGKKALGYFLSTIAMTVSKMFFRSRYMLARAAGIVTRLARVRITRPDNNPAMQLALVADTATRLAHVRLSRRDNRSRRRGLSQRGAGVAAPSPPGDKVIRASAIALRGEGDLGSSKNAQYKTRASDGLLAPRGRGCTITSLSS